MQLPVMPDWFLLIVSGLAAFRLTSIIHSEKIATPFRRLLGVIEEDSFDPIYPDTFIGNLIECYWCVSVWVSFGITLLLLVWVVTTAGLGEAVASWPIWVFFPFTVSALAILFRKLVD